MTDLASLQIDGALEITSDGTPAGTVVSVDGKPLRFVQTVAFRVTPEGVVVQVTALAPTAKLQGRIVTLEKADPPAAAAAPPAAPAP